MHTYDQEKAARVWQRVQAKAPEPKESDRAESLPELIMNEWITGATYLKLARQLGPREATVLQRLFRESQNHTACLKGIYTLMTGRKAVTRTPQSGAESPELTLRRCYGWEMRSLKEYEARSDDPEYGHVFARLAEQEREHCRTVLELIGGLGRKRGTGG